MTIMVLANRLESYTAKKRYQEGTAILIVLHPPTDLEEQP